MKPISLKSRQKGSVLIFSLIILSLMLVTSLTLLSSVVLDQKAALSTGNSTRSFQVADSGIEQVLYQIYKVKDVDATKLQALSNMASATGAACDNGIITSSEGWLVAFYEGNNGETRMDSCSATDWRSRVTRIKSQGSLNGTTRAVEVSVKPPVITP
jgi:Tfp pilus assembly protein PilX